MLIKIERLKADVSQPRQEFDSEQMKRLEDSIKEKGILNDLKVEKEGNDFLVIDGERRLRASLKVGLKELPCQVLDPMGEIERIAYRFHIQEQHASWTPFDRARAIASLKEATGSTVKEVANLIGMAQGTVDGYLTLLSLSRRALEIVADKRIPFEVMKRIGYIKRWYVKNDGTEADANKLEDILMSRYMEGVITGGHIRDLYYAFRNDESGNLVKSYISGKAKSERAIIQDTGIATITLFRDLTRHSSSVIKALKLIEKKNISEHAGERVIFRVEDLMKSLDSFLQSTGYTEGRK